MKRTKLALDPAKRIDFVYLYEVRLGLPNGDPDSDNAPRVWPGSNRLMMTDVCLKRKIRDDREAKGDLMYIGRGEFLADRRIRVVGNEPTDETMRQSFWDVRVFGAVVTKEGKSGLHLRGPVSMTCLMCQHDVEGDSAISIARVCQENSKDGQKRAGDGTFGQKHVVPYALFKGMGTYVPSHGLKSGVSGEDLEKLFESLLDGPEQDISASKGIHAIRHLWIFVHDRPTGSIPRHEIYDSIRVLAPKDRIPQEFSDLAVETNFAVFEDRGVKVIKVR